MKKGILVLLLVLFSIHLFAFDFGLDIENTLNLTADSPTPRLSDTVGLLPWLELKDDTTEFRFALSTIFSTANPWFVFDVDQLSLNTTIPIGNGISEVFRIQAGRFQAEDQTGYVLSQKLDGLDLRAGFSGSELGILLGYTGLLLNPTSPVILSLVDVERAGNANSIFGSPRIIIGLDWQLFSIPSFSLGLQALTQTDLNEITGVSVLKAGDTVDPSNQGGLFQTQYFSAKAKGSITDSFFYSGYFIFGSGQTLTFVGGEQVGTDVVSFASGGHLRLFFDEALESFLTFGVNWSSGDADASGLIEGNEADQLTLFTPISGNPLSFVYSNARLSNLLSIDLEYSIKPFDNLAKDNLFDTQVVLGTSFFIQPVAGVTGFPGADFSSGQNFLGAEVDLSIISRVFSDLGLSLDLGFFFPGAAMNSSIQANGAIFKLDFVTSLSL
jgi:hypothetical protein